MSEADPALLTGLGIAHLTRTTNQPSGVSRSSSGPAAKAQAIRRRGT
ncbi:hypothetical protein [Pararhodobacter sp. SW119]|nr:hypothetical protein [Pararhodobacter sp. SW119]